MFKSKKSTKLSKEDKKMIEDLSKVYDGMKDKSLREIGAILEKDFDESLLCICGGLFEEERVYRCRMALIIALLSLKGLPLKENFTDYFDE